MTMPLGWSSSRSSVLERDAGVAFEAVEGGGDESPDVVDVVQGDDLVHARVSIGQPRSGGKVEARRRRHGCVWAREGASTSRGTIGRGF
jgi:hypothetical protein